MNYKQKVEAAANYVKKLKSGVSEAELTKALEKDNYSKFDIDKIITSAQTIIFDEYVKRTEQYLIEESLEDHLDEFDLVDEARFEDIQHKALENIISKTNATVSKLLQKGVDTDSISAKITNPYYTNEHLDQQIKKFEYYNKPTGIYNVTYRKLTGLAIIILGVGFSYLTANESRILVFIGFISLGLFMLFGNYKTQSDIDHERKFGYFQTKR